MTARPRSRPVHNGWSALDRLVTRWCLGIMPLLVSLSPMPASAATSSACSAAQIVATARVHLVDRSAWPNYPQGPAPDAATRAARRAAGFAALSLKPLTNGLDAERSIDVDWPAKGCIVAIMRGGFAYGVLRDGRPVLLGGGDAVTVGEPANGSVAASEPGHPTLRGLRFVASASVSVGNWRVGLWSLPGHHSLLAAYRPQAVDKSIPILRLADPAIGIAYMSSPDTFGGSFAIVQRLRLNSYRWSFISWSENAVRASAQPG